MKDRFQDGSPGDGMKCNEFDALLTDYLDGMLSGHELETFRSHAEACKDCGPLFTHTQQGMSWMKSLAEVAPPANLVHNILARTSEFESAAPQLAGRYTDDRSLLRRMGDAIFPGSSPALLNSFRALAQPRLAMTAAMAFFSISMLLNLAGLTAKDLRNLDLRPSAISNTASLQYEQTTARVVKYYENIRLVYELETRLNELKNATGVGVTPEEQKQQKQDQESPEGDNTSENPREQNRQNSLRDVQQVLARLRGASPAAHSGLEHHRRNS